LALRLSQGHPLVVIHRLYEHYFAKSAFAHFCVTNMMKNHLVEKYGLKRVIVLPDRPPDRYARLAPAAQATFLQKLPETQDIDRSRTKILVTSTSYTADEPLQPLLSALSRYSDMKDPSLPRILLLITGRGPMQEQYRQMITQLSLDMMNDDFKCAAKMVWLEPDDYPKLLACADLGISLHVSSSGLDFPMKIIDLFGCGVPVCAIRFDA
jgi:beta-1,4-mannosyltransferase